jgi:DoxX-like family
VEAGKGAAPIKEMDMQTPTIGRVLSGLAVLFLLFDAVGKLLEIPPVVAGSTALGYPPGTVFTIGMIELLCVVAYVIPSASVLGAVLLTGYLGGAIATHLRVQNPLFTHTLFPIYVAFFVWGGLFLRDASLGVFFPWRARH